MLTMARRLAAAGMALLLISVPTSTAQETPKERDARMAASGYTVLRFRNEAVLRNPNILIEAVRARKG